MGLYILDSIGPGAVDHPPFGKVSTLLVHGAVRISEPVSFEAIPAGQTVLCVVENPTFESAAVAYSADELRRCKYDTSDRPKTWLMLPSTVVKKLLPEIWHPLIR